MDLVTLALSKKSSKKYVDEKFSTLSNGIDWKGSVDYYKNLPTTGLTKGDAYTVKYFGEEGTVSNGNTYVWDSDSSRWVEIGPDASSIAHKAEGATSGNIAGLDTNGDITDSGISSETVVQKSGTIAEGNVAAFDEDGNVEDSGVPADKVALIDGSYILMNVGTSDNLVDKKAVGSDQSPFLFRPTAGGDISINGDGTAQIKSVHGKTLVWNQLASNSDTSLWNVQNVTLSLSNGEFVLTSTTGDVLQKIVYIPLEKGHKYFGRLDIAAGTANCKGGFFDSNNTPIEASEYVSEETYTHWDSPVVSISTDGCYFGFSVPNNSVVGVTAKAKNLNLFDLTMIFGLNNEPSIISGFSSKYPLPNYDYSAPRLLNFTGMGIKSTGFNLLDPETGKMPVIANEQYQIVGTYTAITSDSEGAITPDSDGYFTPTLPGILTITGATASTCIHFVHSGYRDGETEAYWSETRQLPTETYFPTGMKSVGSVYDELTPNKAITRIGVVDLGSLKWSQGTTSGVHVFTTNAMIGQIQEPSWTDVIPNLLCTEFTATSNSLIDDNDRSITVVRAVSDSHGKIFVHDERYDGLKPLDFKAAMSGVMLYYEVSAPIETPIDPPLNLSYRAADFGVEEVITPAGTAPTTSPLVMKAHYNRDYTRQLDNIADNLGDGAEAGALAESAQAVNAGRLLMGGFDSANRATINDSQIRADIAKTVVEAVYNTPTSDGTYLLKATVSDGEAIFSWEAAE